MGISKPVCKCEFFDYANTNFGYDRTDSTIREDMCDAAEGMKTVPGRDEISWIRAKLRQLYLGWNGEYWLRNDGWADAGFRNDEWADAGSVEYCNWHGLTCDENYHVTEIKLGNNNLTGDSGPTACGGKCLVDYSTSTTSLFRRFDLNDVVHLNLSHSELSGEQTVHAHTHIDTIQILFQTSDKMIYY